MGVGPATGTFPGRNGKIAFSQSGDIFTVRANGTGRTRLTNRGGDPSVQNSSPVWSPGGQRIAFTRFDASGPSLWVMNADGSGEIPVTAVGRGFVQPGSWSPNGRRIAYADDLGDTDPRVGVIKIANADGSGERQLTSFRHLNTQPTWSPGGRKLAYVHDAFGDPQGGGAPGGEIFVMNPDRSGKRRLTFNHVLDEGPAWSPNGRMIAFARTVPGREGAGDRGASIWVMGRDGLGKRRLTHGAGFDQSPRWSPNGRWILFIRLLVERAAVYVVRPDGTESRRVAMEQVDAEWAPDSRWILVAGGSTISAVRVDGTGTRRVARGNPGMDWQALPLRAAPR